MNNINRLKVFSSFKNYDQLWNGAYLCNRPITTDQPNDGDFLIYNSITKRWEYDSINSGISPTGPTGPTGPDGEIGYNGDNGETGIIGVTGPDGITGSDGVTGSDGIIGSDGVTGPDGIIGYEGVIGNMGLEGLEGFQGYEGLEGPEGFQGVEGFQGPEGFQGIEGTIGEVGTVGTNGINVISYYTSSISNFYAVVNNSVFQLNSTVYIERINYSIRITFINTQITLPPTNMIQFISIPEILPSIGLIPTQLSPKYTVDVGYCYIIEVNTQTVYNLKITLNGLNESYSSQQPGPGTLKLSYQNTSQIQGGTFIINSFSFMCDSGLT